MTLAITSPRDGARDLWALAAVSTAILALSALGLATDPRLLDGVPVWTKPAKFAASFVLLFATMALVAERLSPQVRSGRALAALSLLMAVNFLAEMAYMIWRAAQAQHSHFNMSTPVAEAAYMLMGISAVLLIAGVAWQGAMVWRDAEADLGPQTRMGIALGFGLTFALTFVVAGYMGGNGSHHVGTPVSGAALPLVGWSTEVGDLRPAHFAALHAMQALPLLGLALDRAGIAGRAPMLAGAALWSVLTVALFAQALMGLPLVAL